MSLVWYLGIDSFFNATLGQAQFQDKEVWPYLIAQNGPKQYFNIQCLSSEPVDSGDKVHCWCVYEQFFYDLRGHSLDGRYDEPGIIALWIEKK